MRFLRLHAVGFGTLSDYRLELKDGLNVICEENGWGKTTLAVFIKAMLYGLPASTKRSLDENDRKKYAPWQGGAYGGSLEFESEKGRFRIERFFGAKESEDSFCLYELETNLESRAYSSNVGFDLFGIDDDTFERTVYLSQKREVGKADNGGITARLGSLLDDVDDIDTFDGAMAALEKRRQYYVLRGGRGHIADIEEALAEARLELERLGRICESLESREEEHSEKCATLDGLNKELARVNDALGRAGFVSQKNELLKALRDLNEQKARLEACLRGRHPSEDALAGQEGLLEALRDARAKRNAIAAEGSGAEGTRLLTPSAYAASPKGELLPRLDEANRELRELCRAEEPLRAVLGTSRRFADGVPTDGQLESARRALEGARVTEEAAPKKNGAARGIACVLGLAGVDCAVAGVWLLPLLIGGLALLGAAVVVFALSAARAARARREYEARRVAREAEREKSVGAVRAFLSRYGVQTVDLAGGLNELAFLVGQYRSEQEAQRAAREELAAIAEKKKVLWSFLRPSLRLYGVDVGEQSDYRDVIDDLRWDVGIFARFAKEKETRERERAAADLKCRELEGQMRPFAEAFDPSHTVPFERLLSQVRDWERDYRRVCDEEVQKTAALRTLMSERGLDAEADTEDEGVLRARKSALDVQVKECSAACNRLENETKSLAEQAERYPEVEARIRALEEALAEAKQNSRTIELTKDYLEKAKNALSTRYLADMQRSFARFFALVGGEGAPEPVMDTSLKITLRAGGKTRDEAAFSHGWRDVIRFCLRLSLAEALCAGGERPVLILDDPFVNLDEVRLSAAKKIVAALSEEYQIIHTVCYAERG